MQSDVLVKNYLPFFFGKSFVEKNEVGTTLGIGPLQQNMQIFQCEVC